MEGLPALLVGVGTTVEHSTLEQSERSELSGSVSLPVLWQSGSRVGWRIPSDLTSPVGKASVASAKGLGRQLK